MSKKFTSKEMNVMGQTLKITEPTIWALRKNVRKSGQDNFEDKSEGSLYEHLFGYDPIRVLERHVGKDQEIRKGSSENPNLNILNPQTNFLVMDLASDEPLNS